MTSTREVAALRTLVRRAKGAAADTWKARA